MSSEDNQSTSVELSEAERKNLHDLFQRLDVNKDGTIDIDDLTRAMESMQVPQIPGHAQVRNLIPTVSLPTRTARWHSLLKLKLLACVGQNCRVVSSRTCVKFLVVANGRKVVCCGHPGLLSVSQCHCQCDRVTPNTWAGQTHLLHLPTAWRGTWSNHCYFHLLISVRLTYSLVYW